MKPTIVLVHGAFADAASWDGVIDPLLDAGYAVVAAANPLRSLAADATSVSDVVRSVNGPVLLVGHSYGGAVISNVPSDAGEIIGLVYLCAFAPEGGESCNSLARLFPGSTLCEALEPIRHSDGTTDLYISLDRFHDQFCADLPARLAATQRPVTLQALEERSGHRPLWKELPSWFLVGGRDRNTPAAARRYMAERADAHRAVELPYASHAIPLSAPETTRDLILQAASAALAMAA